LVLNKQGVIPAQAGIPFKKLERLRSLIFQARFHFFSRFSR
jgi:hypothetical protein